MASFGSRLASVSVDLDTLPHYCRIHGLDEELLDERARDLVYGTALERFQRVLTRRGVRGTYFAIGEDLARPLAATALRAAAQQGMEIASHSHAHHYGLSRLPPAAIADDLQRADGALREATGIAPVGFRAPGYTLSTQLLQAVGALGYQYDSSAFPAAPYYLAKAMVMGSLRLLGRRSHSILDSPAVLWAPSRPYRISAEHPYRAATDGLLELPITTTPGAQFPFIGTFALTLPEPLVRAMFLSLRRSPHFNFELHALDLLDERDGIAPPLVARQREVRVPHQQKMERLDRILGWLAADFEVVTLAEAAAMFSRQL